MSYQQQTEGKRYQISVLLAQGCSISNIANAVHIHRSTIYREMKRNRYDAHYDASKAQVLARRRKASVHKYRLPDQTVLFVELALSWLWSPEQISGVGKQIGLHVSHE